MKARVRHFVYVSVAQPAPVMKAYQAVRAEGERLLRPTAQRLGLVTLAQMTAALVHAVEHPSSAFRVVEVPEIRGEGSV